MAISSWLKGLKDMCRRSQTHRRVRPESTVAAEVATLEDRLLLTGWSIPGAAAGDGSASVVPAEFSVQHNQVAAGWINGSEEFTVGDFDGDGRDDMVFRNIESGANRILYARGDGFVEVTDRIGRGTINGFDEMASGDFDGDGRDDLIFREVESGVNRILFSRGEGFSDVTNRAAAGWINGFDEMAVGDFDGDGRDDILFREVDSGVNRILFARGNEQFNPVTNRIPTGWIDGADEMIVGDFDGDGRDDVMVRNVEDGNNRIAFARGNEQFAEVTNRIPPGWINGAEEVTVGDLNGDGRDDLIFRNVESGSNRVVYGLPNEQFGEVTHNLPPGAINGFDEFATGDFDGDGHMDLFFREVESGVNRILYAVDSGSDSDTTTDIPPIGFLPPYLAPSAG